MWFWPENVRSKFNFTAWHGMLAYKDINCLEMKQRKSSNESWSPQLCSYQQRFVCEYHEKQQNKSVTIEVSTTKINLKEARDFQFTCDVKRPILSCSITTPNQRTITLRSPTVDSRYSYIDSEFNTGKCGLKVLDSNVADSGNYSCIIVLDPSGSSVVGNVEVDVQVIPELLKLDNIEGRYYYFSKEYLNWTDAQNFCHHNGLQLITINTEQEQRAVTEHLKQTAKHSKLTWLGSMDTEKGSQWFSKDKNATLITQDDDTHIYNEIQEKCTVIAAHDGNNWYSMPCNLRLTFICEINDTIDKFASVKKHTSFIDMLHKFEGNSYYFSGNTMILTWTEAKRFCNFYGMSLAVIESEEENNFIHEIVNNLKVLPNDLDFWLGGTDNGHSDSWSWPEKSGSRFNFTAWHVNKPHNNHVNCLELKQRKSSNESWFPQLCSYQQRFVCEHHQKILEEHVTVEVYDSKIVVNETRNFQFLCDVRRPILNCSIITPTQKTLSRSPWTDANPRYSYVGSGLDYGQCGLKVVDSNGADSGHYICLIVLDPSGSSVVGNVEVTVQVFPELLKLDKIEDRYYYFSKEQLGWNDAQVFCHNNGLNLATLETEQEQRAVTEHLKHAAKHPKLNWLGAINSEYGWQYFSSNDNKTFTAQDETYSLNNETQRCLAIAAYKNNNINSVPCNFNLTFICQMKNSIDRFSTVKKHEHFQHIISNFGGHLYYFSGNKIILTWSEAKRFCNSYGMTLAVVESEEENNFLHGVIKNARVLPNDLDFWLGGTDNGHLDSWFWPESVGVKFNFTAWQFHNPSEKEVHCLEMKQRISTSNESWVPQLCSYQQRFVCEYHQKILNEQITLDVSATKIVVNETRDFQFICDVKRPILSCSITTPLRRTLGISPWTLNARYTFIGSGINTGQCGLKVVDSNAADRGNYSCLIVLDPSGRFIVGNVEVNVQVIPQLLNLENLEGTYYYFSREHLNWNDAQIFCLNNGLELASVETEEEERVVTEHLKLTSKYSTKLSWLGTFMSEDNWQSLSDDNATLDHNETQCLAIAAHEDINLSSAPCNLNQTFICEMKDMIDRFETVKKHGFFKNMLGEFEGNLYYFGGNSTILNWTEAKSFCNSYGMTLAVVESEKENNFIHEVITNIKVRLNDIDFWLGGTDNGRPDSWSWPENAGSKFNFTAWADKTPDKEVHCLEMKQRKSSNESWFPQLCSYQQRFVCEYHENILNEPVTVIVSPTTINVNETQDFQFICDVQRSILSCFITTPNQRTLRLSSPTVNSRYSFIGSGLDNGQCGLKVLNSNAADSGHYSCTIVLDPSGSSVVGNVEVDVHVIPELLKLNKLGSRYYYFSKECRKWNDAQDFCFNNGLELATIETAQEQHVVTEYLRLNSKRSNVNWLGAFNSENGWQWFSSDANMTYSAWDEDYHLSNESDQCLVIAAYEGDNWRSEPCSLNLTFICEMNDTTNKFAVVENHELFPNMMQEFEDNLYYFSGNTTISNWSEAKEFCNSYGMTLADVESKEENNFIHDILQNLRVLPDDLEFWLGGTNNGHPDSWFWPENSGSKFSFTAWHDNSPSNKKDQCLEMKQGKSSDESWSTQLCSHKQRFVCEYHQTSQNEPVTMDLSSTKLILNETQDFQFICDVKRPILSCSITTPFKRTLSMSPWIVDSHYSYLGLGLDTGQCGLKILNSNVADSGNYSCLIVLDPSGSSIVGNIEVKVQEIEDTKIYWKLVFLIFFTSITLNVILIMIITLMCNRHRHSSGRLYKYRLKTTEVAKNGKTDETLQPLQQN